MDLTGKIALVTGSASGLGRATALVLAEKGADVIVNDKSLHESAEGVVIRIRKLGRRAWFLPADVSSETEVDWLFAKVRSEIGKLDILVNNAGTSQARDIFETDPADWDFIIKTNLTSCYLCSRHAMQIMRERNSGGRIVNISSVVGQQGALYGHVHYAASKSAILGLTKTLARTGAPFGIRVNAVAPGIIETDLLMKTHGREGAAEMAANVPLGLGKPRDVGLAVVFLCGEGGNYITGATIDVNGGLYCR